jgi:CRISPR-associated protein Cas2
MPEPRHWYLVMYDVSDPKALRRVQKTLSGWGKPVQYSVFRVRATGREIERLKYELAKIVSGEDRLLYARLCAGCAQRVSVSGRELHPFDLEIPSHHLA